MQYCRYGQHLGKGNTIPTTSLSMTWKICCDSLVNNAIESLAYYYFVNPGKSVRSLPTLISLVVSSFLTTFFFYICCSQYKTNLIYSMFASKSVGAETCGYNFTLCVPKAMGIFLILRSVYWDTSEHQTPFVICSTTRQFLGNSRLPTGYFPALYFKLLQFAFSIFISNRLTMKPSSCCIGLNTMRHHILVALWVWPLKCAYTKLLVNVTVPLWTYVSVNPYLISINNHFTS